MLIHNVEFLFLAIFGDDMKNSGDKLIKLVFYSVGVGIEIGLHERNSSHPVGQ